MKRIVVFISILVGWILLMGLSYVFERAGITGTGIWSGVQEWWESGKVEQGPSPEVRPEFTREEHWYQDIDHLAHNLPLLHADAYQNQSGDAFAEKIEALKMRVPDLEDHEIVAGIMHTVASLQDTHTSCWRPLLGMKRFPLQLRWFGNELYVVGTDATATRALGLRLVSVGTTELKEAAERVSVYLPHGNRWDKLEHEAALVVVSDLLHASGILDDRNRGRFTFMKSDGDTLTLDLKASLWIEWVSDVPTPLYRKSPDEYFWMKHLEDTSILWIRINICADAEDFDEFTKDAMALIDYGLVDTIVIDWRGNSGGNSLVFRPMHEGLRKRAKEKRLRLYGVIDHGTYSSALMNALQFKLELPATLLGEPTGDDPGNQSDVQSFVLPNSKLTVQYSTSFFDPNEGGKDALMPDILLSPSLDDCLSGRDPIYEAIVSGKL
ncbi:MAG: hypothetical protein JXR49_16890 [Acidobacteria bacterium]|nr:hypothetical protein [Acidobacteriota bacterium]